MSGPLDGIRIIEVASWMFIPSGGSVLVDWGADVLKVEHPETGDPQRGLVTSGLLPGGAGAVNFMMEQPNRGKRSVGIDLASPEGHEVLMKLVATADVFLTNYLPQVRAKLKIDTDDIRAANPNIIIARGSGAGPKGPEAHKGGYDGAAFWARGGVGESMPAREGWPPGQPTPAFGDVMAGLAAAGAIAAALVKTRAHRRAERRRRVPAEHRDVAGLADDHRVETVRVLEDPAGRPHQLAEPGCGHLPHERRPVHRPHAPAVGQVLGRLHGAPR